jgi:uncharacterized membrane protein
MATESGQTGATNGGGTIHRFEQEEETSRVSPRANISNRIRVRDPFARVSDAQLTQGLAYFSLGLGLAALALPRGVGHLSGIGSRSPGLVRFIGARELAAGIGLLSSRDPTPWLWARVAGDVMDLLVLGGAAVKPTGSGHVRSLVSMAAVAGVASADLSASVRHSRRVAQERGFAEELVERSTVINKPAQECYQYWRQLGNAPHFMRMVESVTELDSKRSRWVARVPGAGRIEWESRITEDRPGERIAWHSAPNSPLLHAGIISFERAPGDRGTVVRVTFHFRPPQLRMSARVMQALGAAPAFEIREDLRRFKQILETGEIATTRGQPAGRRSLLARLTRTGRGS